MKNRIVLALAAVVALLWLAPSPRVAEAQVPANTFITQSAFQATTTAASVLQLSTASGAPTYCRQVMIAPLQANASTKVEVRFGSSGSVAGFQLVAGQVAVWPVNGPLVNFYVKVFTDGDGVSVTTWTDK